MRQLLLESDLSEAECNQYEHVFASNHILTERDFAMLKREDLIEMNLPIGVRNKILDYISKMKNNKGVWEKSNKRIMAE